MANQGVSEHLLANAEIEARIGVKWCRDDHDCLIAERGRRMVAEADAAAAKAKASDDRAL
jgi:hypothetical protein